MAFATVFVVAGCPGQGGATSATSAPAPTGATNPAVAPRPQSVAKVFTPEATDLEALARWARDATLEPVLRVAALRRLEELAGPEAVPVAAALAREESGLVRDSAVAALVRLRAEDAIATLDASAQELARAMAGGGR